MPKSYPSLFPGGAKKFLSATQARAHVATITTRDIVGQDPTSPADDQPTPATATP